MNGKTRRAIIIGGGIGGLCAGIALRRAGWGAAVYEATPALGEIGAGLTLWPNALRALDALGLGERVRQLGTVDIEGGGINDARGRPLAAASMRAIGARFGATALVVHRAELQALLADTLGREHVHYGARLDSFRIVGGGGLRAAFADGRTAEGDALIGADGLRSVVRRHLLPGSQPRYAGYHAWRAIVPFEHARIATWGESWGRGARFGIAPLDGGRVYWFATRNMPPGPVPATAERSPEGERAALLATFSDWHVPIPALLAATPPAAILRHAIEDLDSLPRWSAGPVTLLGDAAHAMTPNLGQGACQAIEDAAVLADCLRGGADVPTGLRDYEERRRARTAAIARQSRLIGRVGQWSNPLACAIRDAATRRLPVDAQLRRLDPILGHEVASI